MSIKWTIFNKVFGIPSEYREAYSLASDDLDACMVKCLLQGPHMSNVSNAAIANIGKQVNSLVTISGHPCDLAPWERHSLTSTVVMQGSISTIKASLFPLLISFLGAYSPFSNHGQSIHGQLTQRPSITASLLWQPDCPAGCLFRP